MEITAGEMISRIRQKPDIKYADFSILRHTSFSIRILDQFALSWKHTANKNFPKPSVETLPTRAPLVLFDSRALKSFFNIFTDDNISFFPSLITEDKYFFRHKRNGHSCLLTQDELNSV